MLDNAWYTESNMILTGILLIVTSIIAGILVYSLRKIDQFRQELKKFITPAEAGKPSQASLLLENASHVIGHAAAIEIKTTLMGKASVEAKNEAGIISDLTQDKLALDSPIVGALLESFPSLKKRLGKNPALAAMLPSILSKLSGSMGNTSGSEGDGKKSGYGFGEKRGNF